MEFAIDDLDYIISNLSEIEASVGIQNKATIHIRATKDQPAALQDNNNTSKITDNKAMDDRQYCLIIFNNPRWSKRLRSKQKPSAAQEQEQLSETKMPKQHIINNQAGNVSFEDQFISQLRQLINNYMLQTKRTFPLKYFLDFTNS